MIPQVAPGCGALAARYFQRPRYVSPPGIFTHMPPRELTVSGPIFVDIDAPDLDTLIHEFLPTFFLFLYSRPIAPHITHRICFLNDPEFDIRFT